jgi:ADP-ribose pyrophosphatase
MSSKAQLQKEREAQTLTTSKTVYEGKTIQLRVDTYDLNKKKKVFEIVCHPAAVVIVPVDQHNHLILVQQWRRAVKEITIELPAGTLESGEEPSACALRELREETGLSSEKMTPLGGFYSAPGFCDEYLHLFVAEHLKPDPLPADEDEGIDLLHLSIAEAIHLIEQGKIHDAKTIAGILRYQLWIASKAEAGLGG